MKNRKFGRVIVPDKRDARFALSARRSSRRARYWQCNWTGDQKTTPHCVGFAWAHWLACSPRPAYLDGHGIYSLCLFLDEWPGERDEGTSVRAGAKVAQRVGLLDGYQWARTKDALIFALLERGPVVAGTLWYAGMDTPDASNVITVSGDELGGHAFLADGFNRDTGLARIKCAWWLNSTTPWGKNGRVNIAIDDLWDLTRNGGEACLGVKSNVRRAA